MFSNTSLPGSINPRRVVKLRHQATPTASKANANVESRGSRNPKPTKPYSASLPYFDTTGCSGMRPDRQNKPAATAATASGPNSNRLRTRVGVGLVVQVQTG